METDPMEFQVAMSLSAGKQNSNPLQEQQALLTS